MYVVTSLESKKTSDGFKQKISAKLFKQFKKSNSPSKVYDFFFTAKMLDSFLLSCIACKIFLKFRLQIQSDEIYLYLIKIVDIIESQ